MPSNIVDKFYLGDILLCTGGVAQDNIGKYALSTTLVTNYESLKYNQISTNNIDITISQTITYNQFQAYTASVT